MTYRIPWVRGTCVPERHRQRALAIRAAPPDLATALIEYAENLQVYHCRRSALRDTDVVLMTQPSLYGPDLPPTLRELLVFGRVGVERHSAGNEYYSVDALATALGRYNETLLAVCTTARIDCIDLDAKLPKDTTVFYDDVHFNEAGARQVAMRGRGSPALIQPLWLPQAQGAAGGYKPRPVVLNADRRGAPGTGVSGHRTSS